MIIFDTETTGLLEPIANNLKNQPHITEFYGVKIDDKTRERIGVFETLINPGIPIPAEITKITGIDDKLVKGAPKFPAVYPKLCEFFLGERIMCAHNLSYDRDMMRIELQRMGKEFAFPWPAKHICTVEQTEHWNGYRLNLSKLHETVFGEGFDNAHRAGPDVEALTRIVIEKWDELV